MDLMNSTTVNSACIVFSTDANYVSQTCVAIASYALHNPKGRFPVIVIHSGLDSHLESLIFYTAEVFGLEVKLLAVDMGWASVFPVSFRRGCSHVALMTYAKMIALDHISSEYERVIILDSDLLITGDLSGLSRYPLQGCAIAAVRDFMRPDLSHRRLSLSGTDPFYFNAGVLLVDPKKWHEGNPMRHLPDIISTHGSRIMYTEQDILNILFQQRTRELPAVYNYMLMVDVSGEIPNRNLKGESPVVVHFPGQIKPWHEYCPSRLRRIYSRYASACVWLQVPLLKPSTNEELALGLRVATASGNAELSQEYQRRLSERGFAVR